MKTSLTGLRDAVRSQLWPLPLAAVLAALVVGLFLPRVDAAVDKDLPGWLTGVTFGGDADAARTLLAAVSSSLITVTALTFSLTVVTLQLASSQFSPRLLRTFTSDVFVQGTLALFLATFTYSLTVLRSVRSSDATLAEFVPRLSVTLSFLLAVGGVVMLVVFLSHLTRQIRVETMLRDVHADATATIQTTLGEASSSKFTDTYEQREDGNRDLGVDAVPPTPNHAFTVLAPSSGFLARLDHRTLLEACIDLDVVIVLDRQMGSSLVEGTPLGSAWSTADTSSTTVSRAVQERLLKSVHTGFERTAIQDISYGLRQLTDVANKALSPGVNDTTTAVHALGHISALLCEIAAHDLGPLLLRDKNQQVRVVLPRPELSDLIDVAITQPRRYGAADPQVMQRLFQLLSELAWHCNPAQRPTVSAELERLVATVHAQDFDSHERSQLDHAAHQVIDALDSSDPPPRHTTGRT